MEDRKEDRRVIKTKRAIKNAFAELLSLKDINDITVTDIADAADINRKTFYNYYTGVYQIINEIENELAAAFDAAVGEIDIGRDITKPFLIFEKLTVIINSDMDFYSHLMNLNSTSGLMLKLSRLLKDKIKKSLSSKTDLPSARLDFAAEYIVAGMLSSYQSWFNSDRKQSIEELSCDIGALLFTGLNGFIENVHGNP